MTDSNRARPEGPLVPPRAPRRAHVRELHGERFEDPWFWLRERNDPEVRAYLEAENAYAAAWMEPTTGLRERLYEEMVGRILEDDSSCPYPKGDWLYYSRTAAGRQHRIHCRRSRHGGDEEQILLDLNELGRGLGYIALGELEISDDGRRMAYTLDTTGFREHTLHVVEIESGEPLLAPVERVGSVAWAADGETLLYALEDAAKRPHLVVRRSLAAGEPEVVLREEDERFRVGVQRTRSGDLLVLTAASHTTSELRLLSAAHPAGEPRLVAAREPDHEYDLDHAGGTLFVRSNSTGRNFALFTAPLAAPERSGWRPLVPHDPAVMIERVDAFASHLVLAERAGGLPRFRVLDHRGGAERFVEFPEPAYTASPGPNEEFASDAFRYAYQSMTTPPSVCDYRFAEGDSVLRKRDEVPGYEPSLYVSERLEATAADGTALPISLVRGRRTAAAGAAPTLLRGYGSYGISYPAAFDPNAVSLLDRGFALAIAHVRGGGELGESWHDAGKMALKTNTFDDFVACAEELVRRGVTARDRLAIAGGSAGGLLVGAVVNRRPELVAAALSYVPFVDVLNTMSDPTLPLTVGEYEEWGNPAIEEQYRWIRAYSPYDNLEAKAYPAMLVRTSFWDSQVMYWEPAKYVARLRSLKIDDRPLLFRTNMDAGGHGGFAGRYDRARDTAFDFAFLLTRFGRD